MLQDEDDLVEGEVLEDVVEEDEEVELLDANSEFRTSRFVADNIVLALDLVMTLHSIHG